ncbi:MAG: HAD family hydrolase [Fusobacteriaceae bacterium]
MSKIKNVIFDLGNVLIEFHPEKFIEKNIAEEDREDFYREVFKTDDWLDLDRGTLTYDGAVELFSSKFPKYREAIKDLFDNNVIECLTPIEENIKIMQDLKKQGYKLYILSNFHEPSFNYIYARWQFFENFDGKVVSSHCNLLKPEPEIYEEILQKYNLVPEETLFIDDVFVNIDAAKQFNINVIHLEKPQLLKEKIKEFI